MFSGLVADLGSMKSVAFGDAGAWVEIATGLDISAIGIGDSIACSGVCLTVTETSDGRFAADISRETLDSTTLGDWREGAQVNLEKSLRMGDEIGGHLVSGHVDGVAEVVETRVEGDSVRFVFEPPAKLAGYIASKGSVALDGVSLTVNEVTDRRFGVNIISHTARMTTFGSLEVGSRVNIEIDMLARYIERILEVRKG